MNLHKNQTLSKLSPYTNLCDAEPQSTVAAVYSKHSLRTVLKFEDLSKAGIKINSAITHRPILAHKHRLSASIFL